MSGRGRPEVVDFDLGGGVVLRMVSREIALEPPAGKLTPAERAVCQLALAGLGNRAIAHARGVSERTIANQLQSIYGKFHARGRRELARAVASSPLAR